MQADQLATLPVAIDSATTDRHERATSSGFTRVTTELVLHGDEECGRGEDVTYEPEEHDALTADGLPDLTGEYTFAEFSAVVNDLTLFSTPPDREVSRNYRQWALESAALDLGLRQAETDFASLVGHEYEPVRFVASTRLGEPPTTDRVDAIHEAVSDAEFKLDPTPDWDDALVETLAGTNSVQILDLKGHYEGTEVDVPPDPELYERIIKQLPHTIIEDPALTEETQPLFEVDSIRERVSWDEPIESLGDVKSLPWTPSWLNIKPSRFGTIESLFGTIEWAEERGVTLYGGGQFELGVGRDHIQLLASLFYPDGPNDVAPGGYNEPTVASDLPSSPLAAPTNTAGLGWD